VHSRDGRTLASAGWDRLIKLWDARTGRELRSLWGHDNWVMGVAFTPDSRNLASLDYDGVLRHWGEPPGQRAIARDIPAQVTGREAGRPGEKASAAPIPDVSSALIGRWEGTIKFDEHDSPRLVIRVAVGPNGRLPAVADSPDQGAKDLPVSAMRLEQGVWSWIIASAGVDFEGKATKTGDAYEGEFRQFGRKVPLVLKRTDRPH
jgi:WD40 repeat protein